ncbi:MAG TPA: hypothetical protein VGP22_01970 [Albitalea sp.]|nr:hypothetical protein [Albitalea sp.]
MAEIRAAGLQRRTTMNAQDRTIIVVEGNPGFTPAEFVLSWNAQASRKDLPLATLKQRGTTYDAALMSIVGDVANVIQIISFIGVPTVAMMVQRLMEKRALSLASSPEAQPSVEFEFDETIIDLDQEGKVQRITIRRSSR